MKKSVWYGIFMVLLFIMVAAMVQAMDDSVISDRGIRKEAREGKEGILRDVRSGLQEKDMQMRQEVLRDVRAEIMEDKQRTIEAVRRMTQANTAQVMQNLQRVQDRASQLRMAAAMLKEKVSELQGMKARCINKDDCPELLLGGKEHLLGVLSSLQERLEHVKERAENAPQLDDDAQVEITADMDEALAQVEKVRSQVEAANTIAELREARAATADLLQRFRVRIGQYQKYREEALKWRGIVRVFMLWDARLQRYVANNEISDALRAQIANYHEGVEDLKERVQSFAKETRPANRDEITPAVRDDLRREHASILEQARELRKLLHDIVQQIRAKGDASIVIPIEREIEEVKPMRSAPIAEPGMG